ncbi:MAG: hypothetical protein Q8L49_01750 [Burkholderiaceae bacterium]|nr:hypothetical protein [Burkholderiaceae bacterium]
MNKLFIAAAVVATSFSALADGATYEYPQPITSAVSRAEVNQALDEARRNPELVSGETNVVAEAQSAQVTRVASR